jgi:tight adherence protein B
MMGRRAIGLIAAALVGTALTPTAAGAAGGVDVRLNEAAAWPNRELVLSLPSKRVLTRDQVSVSENGIPVEGAKVTSEANNRKRGVMLAIDASLTMRGAPIREAMAAARAFARRRSETTPVGILFFSGSPRVALKPTTNPLALRTALSVGPALTQGTRIFDAAAAGIGALHDASLTSGAIVVLSDGAEAQKGSAITPVALAALARRSNVRVFSVGLSSRSFNSSSLRSMADLTGGRYGEAARPKDLPPIFAALGERLSSEYLVSYRSTAPAGAPVNLSAHVSGFAGNSSLSYKAPALTIRQFKAAGPRSTNALDASRVLLISLATFLVIGLVLYLLLRPKQRSLVSRVTDFSGDTSVKPPTLGDVRRRPEREPSQRWQRYSEAVELADVGVTPTALALWTAIGTVVFAWYVGFAAGEPALIFLAVAIPLAARLLVVSRLAARRREFEDQLPDNLQVLASALRAGYSFSAGLASMAEDAPEPSKTELRRASTDEQLGMDVSEALRSIAERMQSSEIEYVGIVAKMQRESGGNTAEVLDQVIETIRERQKLKRMVRALTAQGRLGGMIISAMPVVVSVGMAVINPGYFDPMFRSPVGVILVFAGVVMLISGWLIIRKVVDVEP